MSLVYSGQEASIPTADDATPNPSIQTGVGFLLRSAHRDIQTGQMHGHTYEVICWFVGGWNAVLLQERIEGMCRDLDHAELPAGLAWAEAIASEVKRRTNAVEVDVNRPLERLYARAR